LEELLPTALELTASARRALLDRECAGDAALRAELESLIGAHERAGLLDVQIPEGERWLAPGTVVSHYQLRGVLGRGGMGVVHRAVDLRLGRTVALKFLPLALSVDALAKRRFVTEAQAAAALQHPNVCTIHEIGETEQGQLFIAMAFVDGESLRERLGRGALEVTEAVAIAHQIGAALGAAHRHGIVHRDVKPANVMLDPQGSATLVDFGVAKLDGSTMTGGGLTPGTTAYMSPEQVRGEAVDHRTDVWSLGVVLYEMLSGVRPFRSESDMGTRHAITSVKPARLRALRNDVPPVLDALVGRALAKRRDRRFQSAGDMAAALERVSATPVRSAASHRAFRARVIALSALATVVLVPAAVWGWRRWVTRQARDSLPNIEVLARAGDYRSAFELATKAERALGEDATLARLLPLVSDRLTIVSHPPGARVWLRRVDDDGALASDSVLGGDTPVRNLRVARADYRLDIRKPVFAPVARIASSALNRAEASLGVTLEVTLEVTLREVDRVPKDMIYVPGGRYALVGREAPMRDPVALHDFFIDAYEVTNAQFREFVVAGGYADARYWRHPFHLDGRTLPFAEAVRRFVDRTGLPAPRAWSGQEIPAGLERHPVTGVTWYEAAAYAEWARKRLPSVFEWEKAARDGQITHFEYMFMPWGLADPTRGVAGRANFGGRGTIPVDGHAGGISAHGAYNMAGNVEEWVANPRGRERVVTGGAWDDPMYVFPNFLTVSGFHASASLGFRTARSLPGTTGDPGVVALPIRGGTREYRPVDDANFRTLLRHYAYDPTPLEPRVLERESTAAWVRESIGIAGPWPDRTVVHLYLPTRAARPLQPLLYLPGVAVFYASTLGEETEHVMSAHVKAGRAVVAVQFKGMLGRPWDAGHVRADPASVQYRQELVFHAIEMRRAIDYIATRTDLDVGKLAYVGFSKGSGSWVPFIVVEPRFRAVVLIGGGFDEAFLSALPEANMINFVSRIRAPTLLVSGRYDEEAPWDHSARPLWRLLSEPKTLAIVDGGHLPPAESRVPVINAWLDKTLGPPR
jgi:eukaryotic-like serine/threonine-protein kinase